MRSIMILFALFCIGAVSYTEADEQAVSNDSDMSAMTESFCCMEPDEYRPPVIRLVYGQDMCCMEPDGLS